MDNKAKKEKVNIVSIPSNAEITITVGGLFYQRLNKLLIDFADSVDQKVLLNAMYQIKLGKSESDPYAFNLETLIILLRDIEQKFKETDQVIDTEVDAELPDDLKNLRDEFDKAGLSDLKK